MNGYDIKYSREYVQFSVQICLCPGKAMKNDVFQDQRYWKFKVHLLASLSVLMRQPLRQ